MPWSLYVSGGQQFLPAFCGRLFESGDVAQATRAGRQQMFANPDRVCARGNFQSQDWLVPVVYQQEPFDFSFASRNDAPSRQSHLPEEARDAHNPYAFVRRDGALLKLERAMRQDAAGVLVHGLGGVGKTTLARGFVAWLEATEGLGRGCFWFTFDETLRNAESIINRIGEAEFGQRSRSAAKTTAGPG